MATLNNIVLNRVEYDLSGGLTEELKIALASGFSHVGWDTPNGLSYYNAIVNALDIQISCTGITLSQSAISSLSEGSATTITANVTPSNTTEPVIWSSSDETVATVSAGVITGVYEGSCTITATCGKYSASCAVTVVFSGNLHTVTNNLTHCTTSNTSVSVHENATYTATLIPSENYEFLDGSVSVTLGGVDVTSSAFNLTTGVITVVATGDIVITASAVEKLIPTWTSGTALVIDGSEVVTDKSINSNTGAETSTSGTNATGYLNIVGAFAVYNGISSGRLYWYNRDKKFISSTYTNTTYSCHLVPAGASYVRSTGSSTQVSPSGTSTLKLIPMRTPEESYTAGVQEITWEAGGGTGKSLQSNYTPIYGAKKITVLGGTSNNYYTLYLYDADKNLVRQTGSVNLNPLTDESFFQYAYMRIFGINTSNTANVVETLYDSES